ncbi:hypothetical protein KC19_1G226100 [Ceratodon purpureus]|uniref:Dirigent protein n=1 Tax=Ceratodon purpureus TaxID=3225 RepID=A0A8T0JAX2_CERPU|nr:hypothetical protein KC19_1G226100 [Ceratodon purpureus]
MAMGRARFVVWVLLAWCVVGVSAARDGPSNLEFFVHNPGLFTSFPNPAPTVLTSANLLAMRGEGDESRRAGGFKSRIITFDNTITAANCVNAPVMGRAHGIRVVDKVGDGPLAFTWLFTASFNTSMYNGTLSFQGTTLNFPSSEISDITVTGGTGTFRFARGYATFTNFYKADEISTLEGQHFQVFLRY